MISKSHATSEFQFTQGLYRQRKSGGSNLFTKVRESQEKSVKVKETCNGQGK